MLFHNLRGYDSHLIFYELKKFDVKIDVTPKRFAKYMVFILNKNLVFIDSMQFINSSLEKLLKNLSDNYFQIFESRIWFKKFRALKTKRRSSI